MKISFEKFNGIIPAVNAKSLPDLNGQIAENCTVKTTKLTPLKELSTEKAITSGTKTIYKRLMASGSSEWLDWTELIDAVKAPISSDDYKRIVWTGASDGKFKIRGDFGTDGAAETRDEEVSKPSAAPTVTVNPFWGIDETGHELYAYFGYQTPLQCTYLGYEIVEGEDNKYILKFRYPGSYTTSLAGTWYSNIEYLKLVLASGDIINSTGVASILEDSLQKYNESEIYCSVEIYDVATANEDSTYAPSGYEAKMNPMDINVYIKITHSSSVKTRYYIYSHVDDLDQEGPPSDLSELVAYYDGDTFTVNTGSDPGGNITTKRLYRSAGGSEDSDFYPVDDITAATANYTDELTDDEISSIALPAYGNPPENMHSLVAMPGNFLAAASGNDVYMTETNRPYCWPAKYGYTTQNDVVGLGVAGSNLVALTEGIPEIFTGSHPLTMAQIKLPYNQACVSKRSICSAKGAVFYASPDGLAMINGQSLEIITQNHFTKEQWTALTPETMICSVYDDKIHIFTAANGTYIIDIQGGGIASITTADETVTGCYSDILSDSLYIVQDTNLQKWDGGTVNKRMSWKSKVFNLPRPSQWAAAKVIAESYPTTEGEEIKLFLYAEGVQVAERTVTSGSSFRLPIMRRECNWEVEVRSNVEIHNVIITQSMGEM